MQVTTRFGVGGSISICRDLKTAGRVYGHAVRYMTFGDSNNITTTWRPHVQACVNEGFTPGCNFWYFGDVLQEDGVNRIKNGYAGRTWEGMKAKAQAIAEESQLQGARGTLYVIETEFNKGGVENWASDADPRFPYGFNSFFTQIRDIFKQYDPGCDVMFSPGNYRDETAETNRFARAVDSADVVGIGGPLFNVVRPAEGWNLQRYQTGWDYLLAGVREVRAATVPNRIREKPVIINDMLAMTYGTVAGTHFQTAHPFAPISPNTELNGSNGGRLNNDQKALFEGIRARRADFKAENVEYIFYRAYFDDHDRGLGDYFGYAERHSGLFYADSYG